MAYAVLVSLTRTIDRVLRDHDRYSISLHDEQHIISIHEYIVFLQAFLEDFPDKASSLEGQIRDVAAKAEDIIEELMLEDIRPHYISKTQSNMFMCLKRRKWHQFGFQDQLEEVTAEIDSIARDVMEIKNSTKSADHTSVATSSSIPKTALTSKDIAMVGFEEDLLAIKARLCGESPKLQVIPIFGMGGIGKTTLARNAYDDPLTVEHFHLRTWVTVSQDYSARHILSNLLVSVGAKYFEESDESKKMGERSKEIVESRLAVNVYKRLKGRRYLIVMDDIWKTKVWDDVRRIFPDDHNGSRIILTTRLWDVAAYPDSSSPLHEMHFMDPNQSWNLLRQKVFKQDQCPLELENIGKEIARKCRGLPLAIVLIAGLLSTGEAGENQTYWKKIAENVDEVVTANNEEFADIVLSLSYNHLPQHLKPCFLYMGGFPEDYVIRVSKLIRLYVAEGFLKLPNGSKSCEETAEEFLEDLVKRSLVLVNRRKSNGKIKRCSVHDLVRNLCIRKAQEEKFFLHVRNSPAEKILPESEKGLRRLSFQLVSDPYLPHRKIYGSTSVHTVLCFQNGESFSGILENFRLLRVLDAGKITFHVFPVEILELFHLQYLAFAYTESIRVPASILKLENLQFLIIWPSSKMVAHMSTGVYFPSEIWRMSQLRHVLVFALAGLPYPDHALVNLQTLAQLINFQCTKRMVQAIPSLKKLKILYTDVLNWELHELHNLVHMHQLEEIKIWVKGRFIFFWENLAFPTMLKKLNLSGFKFGKQDMAIVGSLPNLEVLKLRLCSFKELKWETSEGEFLRLKFLQIRFGALVHWITENSHFPSLEHLQLYGCKNLLGIPDDFGEIPTLELIEVDEENKSLAESAKSIQEEQQSFGNDALLVRVVRRWTDEEWKD